MRSLKKIVSFFCVIAIIVSIYAFLPVAAEDTVLSPGTVVRRFETWNNQEWEFESIANGDGVPVPVSYVNENGHLVLESNAVSEGHYRRMFYPPRGDDGSDTDVNGVLTVLDGGDQNRNNDAFDINWRMRVQNFTEFSANWYLACVNLTFMDGNSIVYSVEKNNGRTKIVKVDFGEEWHDWTLSVRGIHATLLMDGEELFNYQIYRQASASREIYFRNIYRYDYESVTEVESLEVVDKRSNEVNLIQPQVWNNGQNFMNRFYVGDSITFEADAGAADGEQKTIEFYANGVRIGSAIDQGIITTTTGGDGSNGCDGDSSSTTTEPAHNAIFTLKNGLSVGRYNITAVCEGSVSAERVLIVENRFDATLECTENALYGEAVEVKINGDAYRLAELFVDGESVGTSEYGDTLSASGFSVGSHTVRAKLYLEDGIQFVTGDKIINISASGDAVKSAEINREYMLDYTVSGDGEVCVNDGYFTLSLVHSEDVVTYKSTDGVEEYPNLGSGEYRVVTTGGYAEVYYNGQMAYTFRMPYTGKSESSVDYSGSVSDVRISATGVKATKFHKDVSDMNDIAEYGVEMDSHYSVEFDKNDLSAQSVMIYDGTYEAVINFDSEGITVNSQRTRSAGTTKDKLSDSFTEGYYRLTVADGMAQLFVDNRCLGSFRCPVNPHRKAILMENATSTTFIAVKNTDDIYYYSEDFEGNCEKGYSYADYWYNEEEYYVLAEGEEYNLKYTVEGEGDKYLSLSGNGEYLLNVNADDPVVEWTGSYEGEGSFEARIRCYVNFGFLGAKYDGATGLWSLRVSQPFEGTKTNENGATEKITVSKAYEIVSGVSYPLSEGEHQFEFSAFEDTMTFKCDGNVIMETDRLGETFTLSEDENGTAKNYSISNNRTHGRVGFAVEGGKLRVDDFSYSGDGNAAPGVTYSRSVTNFDYYRNHKGQLVGGSNDYARPILISDDDGLSWSVTYPALTGRGKLSHNTINLMSGKVLRVQYAPKDDVATNPIYSYALLYNKDVDTEATRVFSNYLGGKYAEFSSNRVMIEPDGSMDDVPYSGMATRLIQLKSGPYAGRVIYTRGGSGEERGIGYLYYSDDYKDPDFEGNPVWHEPNIQLSYENTGGCVFETQCVEMPDGTVRCYVRSDRGFLTYFESFDGGATWDPTQRKVEDLFTSSCCFSIMRVDDTETYCAFWEYETVTSNMRYYNRPRNRASFAISYDGMKTWEFVADMEEREWNNGGAHCNNSMRYIDGVAYMGYFDQTGLPEMSRNFRQDLSKLKPLKRFAEAHKREVQSTAGTINDMKYDYCVIPKISGDAFMYGSYIHADVNPGGFASGELVAKAIGAQAEVSDDGVIWSIGDTKITFTNDSTAYDINGETVDTGEVVCVDGYLNSKVTEYFGKRVYENDEAYIILNGNMSDDNIEDIVQVGLSMTVQLTREECFLADINEASMAGNGDAIRLAFEQYQNILEFVLDVTGVNDVAALYQSMTDVEYTTIQDVENVFTAAKTNLIKAQSIQSGVALSTPGSGFDGFAKIGKDNGTVTMSENAAIIEINQGVGAKFVFGTPGIMVPQNEFNFTFDYKLVQGGTTFNIGNGKDMVHFVIDESEIAVYTGERIHETAIELESDKWYTIKGGLKHSADGKVLTMMISGTDGELVSVCDEVEITKTGLKQGFWTQWSGVEAAKIYLRNIRVYKGKAIDVVDIDIENGVVSGRAELLNDETEVVGGKFILAAYQNDVQTAVSEGECWEETIVPFGTKEYIFENISCNTEENTVPKIKLFVWNGENNLIPVAEMTEIY